MKISFIIILLCSLGVVCKSHFRLKRNRQIKDSDIKNELLSPFSLSANLIALYFGGNDNLRTQIKRYLNLSSTDEEIGQQVRNVLNKYNQHPAKLVLSSKPYLDKKYPILPSFQRKVKMYLNMEARNIDYTNPSQLETSLKTWINTLTRSKIKILIKSVSDLTAFIMPNVILMEAAFRFPFDKSLTKFKPFHNWASMKTNVPMMRHKSLEVKYNNFDCLDAEVIELPIRDSSVSMFIVLPNKLRSPQDVKTRLNKYNTLTFSNQLRLRLADITIPKFDFMYTTYLRKYLEYNGLKGLFDIGSFPKLTLASSKIHIHDFKQTVAVKIDENGLYSPGATFCSLRGKDVPADFKFEVNRPFGFYIQDKNNVFFKGFIYAFK